MKNLLIIFRNYLHSQSIDSCTTENELSCLQDFFKQQQIDLTKITIKNLTDLSKVRAIFDQQLTKTSKINTSNSLPDCLYRFGQCLTANSFFSENPAEKLLNSQSLKSISSKLNLREISENTCLSRRNENLNSTLPLANLSFSSHFFLTTGSIFFLFILVLNLVFGSRFIFEPNRLSTIGNSSQKKVFLSSLLVKPIFAQEKFKYLDIKNNLFDELKIVSSSASRVTK